MPSKREYKFIEELYKYKHFLYQTEILIDRQISEEFSHCEIKEFEHPHIDGQCSNYMNLTVYTNPYDSNKKREVYDIIYAFDKNKNQIRYPIVLRDGMQFGGVTITETFAHGEQLENGQVKYTNTIKYCGDCVAHVWYVVNEISRDIVDIGIQYFSNDGEVILHKKINSQNQLTTIKERKKNGPNIGYKAAKGKNGENCIITLEIPENALLASAPHVDKVRTNICKVVKISCKKGNLDEAYSFMAKNDFLYRIGDTIQVDDFDRNLHNVCVPGIHFHWLKSRTLQYFGAEDESNIDELDVESII